MMISAADQSHGYPAFWLTRTVHGMVAGAAIAALDFLHYAPFLSASKVIGVNLFLSSLVVWCGECALFALALALAERLVRPAELRVPELALAIVVAAAVSVLAWQSLAMFLLRDHLGMPLFREHVGQPMNWTGTLLYHAWLLTFFGGLIAAVVASQRWRSRMLTALRSAEIGRARSQQRLAEAKLASLETHIDPRHLYQTLSRLEALYEHDPPAADDLLDELIASLRAGLAAAHTIKSQEDS